MRVLLKIASRLFGTLAHKVKLRFDLPFEIEYINFPVTYLCNARCGMCSIWEINRKNPEKLEQELSADEIIGFFEHNKGYLKKLRNIGITGGEPTLKKGLTEIIAYLRNNYPSTRVGLQTNGLSPDLQIKVIEEIHSIYPEIGLAVSLDGLVETHERIRGIKGAYGKAITTIKAARDMGINEITCGFTISKENIGEIMDVMRVCRDLECEFSCFLAENGDYFNNEEGDSSFTRSEKENIASILENFSYHYYMDNTRLQLLEKRKREIDCYSGRSSIVIDPYGNVKPCLVLDVVFGNIREKSLREIFESEEVKSKQREIKSCKKCFLQCEVGTSLLMDFTDLLKWFLFYSNDRVGFLKTYLAKYNKAFYKDM